MSDQRHNDERADSQPDEPPHKRAKLDDGAALAVDAQRSGDGEAAGNEGTDGLSNNNNNSEPAGGEGNQPAEQASAPPSDPPSGGAEHEGKQAEQAEQAPAQQQQHWSPPPAASAPADAGAGAGAAQGGSVSEHDAAMAQLTPTVVARLQQMFDSGKCGKEELEACCIDSLRDFSEDVALQIVDKFMEADLENMRSKTAFFIGILKRHRSLPKAGSLPPAAAAAPAAAMQAMPGMMGGMAGGMAGGMDQQQMYSMAAMYNPMGGLGGMPMMDVEKERALQTVPPSVRYKFDCLFLAGRLMPAELETCCIDSLRDFDEITACEIVDKFAEADFGRIHNKTAFFIGILKRYRSSSNPRRPMYPGAGAGGGGGGGFGGPMQSHMANPAAVEKLNATLATVPQSVRDRLEVIFNSGQVRREELEACCIDSLRDFPEDMACQIVDKFAEADMSTVRNKTAFFIGVLKRFRGQRPSAQASMSGMWNPYPNMPNYAASGGYPPQYPPWGS